MNSVDFEPFDLGDVQANPAKFVDSESMMKPFRTPDGGVGVLGFDDVVRTLVAAEIDPVNHASTPVSQDPIRDVTPNFLAQRRA